MLIDSLHNKINLNCLKNKYLFDLMHRHSKTFGTYS